MNREAAALGVPVYSIFRGKTAAVDIRLQEEGRLVLIENTDQRSKDYRNIADRFRPAEPQVGQHELDVLVPGGEPRHSPVRHLDLDQRFRS